MKKELFNEMVKLLTADCLKAHDGSLPVIKHTETDELITYHFPNNYPKDIDEKMDKARAVFKEHGYKGYEVYKMIEDIVGRGNTVVKTNISILYNKEKDKISISSFEVGFKYAGRKERFYPTAKNTPIFCYSKRLYSFYFGKPRLMKGMSLGINSDSSIMKLILGIDFVPQLNALTKYYVGAKDDWDVLTNMHGVVVPKALRTFPLEEINILYSVLQNKDEVNKICQHLAKKPKPVKTVANALDYTIAYHGTISAEIAEIANIDPTKQWLVGDWIRDCYALGKKITLKITSVKRLEEEHRKMSKERMIKGIRAIKVDDKYKELFKDSDINAELITDKKRLLQESIEQDHCVATYGHAINTGKCAIFSILFNGVRYTLQVDSLFRNAQFRGFRNCDVPDEIRIGVESYLVSHHQLITGRELAVAKEDALPF